MPKQVSVLDIIRFHAPPSPPPPKKINALDLKNLGTPIKFPIGNFSLKNTLVEVSKINNKYVYMYITILISKTKICSMFKTKYVQKANSMISTTISLSYNIINSFPYIIMNYQS